MKKTHSLFTMMLIFALSANTVFAENSVLNVEEAGQRYADGLEEVQNKAIEAKSATLDAVMNVRSETKRLKENKEKVKNTELPDKPKNHPQRNRNPVIYKPVETAMQKFERFKRNGRLNPDRRPKTSTKNKNFNGGKLTVSQVRNIFYPGIPAKKLTSKQRKALLNNYNWLLKEKVTLAFLIAILKSEGATTPKTVVGGIKRKSSKCQKLIKRLDLRAHAVEQGLPQPCFLTTSEGPSSAYGYFQMLYYKTWRTLKNQFGFKNFSRKTQVKGALELARRRGNGAGFIALVRGDLDSAIKKATGDWAGSDFSDLPGAKRPILKYAREEYKKLKDKAYYQKWLDEFTDDSTS